MVETVKVLLSRAAAASSLPVKLRVLEASIALHPGNFKLWFCMLEVWLSEIDSLPLHRLRSCLASVVARALKQCPFPTIIIRAAQLMLRFGHDYFLRTLALGFECLPPTQHKKMWQEIRALQQRVSTRNAVALELSQRVFQASPRRLEDVTEHCSFLNERHLYQNAIALVLNNVNRFPREAKSELLGYAFTCCDQLTVFHDALANRLEGELRFLSSDESRAKSALHLFVYFTRCGEFMRARDLLKSALLRATRWEQFHRLFAAWIISEFEVLESAMSENWPSAEAKVNCCRRIFALDSFGEATRSVLSWSRSETALWAQNAFEKEPSVDNALKVAAEMALADEPYEKTRLWFQKAIQIGTTALRPNLVPVLEFGKYLISRTQLSAAKQLLFQVLEQLRQRLTSQQIVTVKNAIAEIAVLESNGNFALVAAIDGVSPSLAAESALHTLGRRAFPALWSLRFDLNPSELTRAAEVLSGSEARRLVACAATQSRGRLSEWGRLELLRLADNASLSSLELSRLLSENSEDQAVRLHAAIQEERCGSFEYCLDHHHALLRLSEEHCETLVKTTARLAGNSGLVSLANTLLSNSLPLDVVRRGVLIAKAFVEINDPANCRYLLKRICRFAEPENAPNFWAFWRDFEIGHGNHESWEDMERSRRAVQFSWSGGEAGLEVK